MSAPRALAYRKEMNAIGYMLCLFLRVLRCQAIQYVNVYVFI